MNLITRVDRSIDPNIKIPSLIIQPFVENSIKHAFRGIREGEIKIHIIEDNSCNEFLFVLIEDNGCGKDSSAVQSNERRSFGIDLIKERIKLFGGKEEAVRINHVKTMNRTGTIVELLIPYKT